MYINEGEMRDLQAQLPRPIADLWEVESFETEDAQGQKK